jgi:hypothetical protein
VRGLGIVGHLPGRVVAVIAADRDRWVRMMLRYEYWLPDVRQGRRFRPSGARSGPASAATSLTFVLIGALKSRWSLQPWWQSGLGRRDLHL